MMKGFPGGLREIGFSLIPCRASVHRWRHAMKNEGGKEKLLETEGDVKITRWSMTLSSLDMSTKHTQNLNPVAQAFKVFA